GWFAILSAKRRPWRNGLYFWAIAFFRGSSRFPKLTLILAKGSCSSCFVSELPNGFTCWPSKIPLHTFTFGIRIQQDKRIFSPDYHPPTFPYCSRAETRCSCGSTRKARASPQILKSDPDLPICREGILAVDGRGAFGRRCWSENDHNWNAPANE